MWKFLVKNQKIEVLEREVIASDQISFVTLKFIFDGDWKKFHKVVQFTQCDETFNKVLGFDGLSCLLPAELHAGAVKMSVFGYDADNTEGLRATTVPVTLNIRPSGFVGDDDPPIPPTPDLYTQLLQKIKELCGGGKGADGKSAYEIAVENGFTGSLTEWLDTLKGNDGLSAYEIAVRNGYSGTEEQWLASLQGKDGIAPDMSEYPNITEITTIIEREIQSAGGGHQHNNQAVLDSITAVDKQLDENSANPVANYVIALAVDVLKAASHTHENAGILEKITEETLSGTADSAQFQDSVKEQLHTLNEEINNFSNSAHTHENQELLDSLSADLIQLLLNLQQFKDSTVYEIQTIKETIAPVVDQAHWHDNLDILNEMTADKNISALERKIDFLQDNLMDYQMATNHRFETVEAELKEIREMLETLGEGSAVTLFQSGSDTLSKYGELLYTFFNDGFRSLSGFVKSYPNFCSAANDYALSYNQSDFGWAGTVYTICTAAVSITPKSCIMFSYKAGAADSGELYLVRKNTALSGSALANYIYEQIENETTFMLPFKWLYSDTFVSVMQGCENIPAGDFYLAWKAVSDNTHPVIRTIKILEG